jgi:hypothetical protein
LSWRSSSSTIALVGEKKKPPGHDDPFC